MLTKSDASDGEIPFERELVCSDHGMRPFPMSSLDFLNNSRKPPSTSSITSTSSKRSSEDDNDDVSIKKRRPLRYIFRVCWRISSAHGARLSFGYEFPATQGQQQRKSLLYEGVQFSETLYKPIQILCALSAICHYLWIHRLRLLIC